MKTKLAIFLSGLMLLLVASSCVGYYHDRGPRYDRGHHYGHYKKHHNKYNKHYNRHYH